jgi:membrane protein YqaA with SNARE-associated domain
LDKKNVGSSMASLIEFALVFVIAFGANMIPFAGPSNLLIPSWFPFVLENADVSTLFIVGFLIALAAASAKGIHYMVTFFVSKHLSAKRQARLDADGVKVRRWAFPLLFLAAATPIPDEPVIIPLGLMKYSPAKFFAAYFLGKLSITVAGAFLANKAGGFLSAWLSPEVMIGISIVLTVVITIILLKVDMGKMAEKYLHRKPKADQEKPYKPSQEPTSDDAHAD